MGEDAARALDRLAKLTKSLADAGLIEQQGGRIELHAPGGAAPRPEGAGRPVRPDQQGPHRRPLDRADGCRPRPRGDDEGLRVRRPAEPAPLDDGAQRRAPRRIGRARAPQARGLRGGRGRGAVPVGHRAGDRPVHVDADARQLRAGQAHGHGAADADLVQVPPRLPRHRRASPRSPARYGPTRSPRPCGTTSTAPTCSTRWRCRGACWPTSTGPSRSSW